MKFRIFLLLGISVFEGKIYGQSVSGSLEGTISNLNGTALSGAGVQAKNTATSAAVRTISKPDGRYTLANLPTETYEVSVNMPSSTGTSEQARHTDALATLYHTASVIRASLQEWKRRFMSTG